MIELQAFAALLALERARELAVGRVRRTGRRPVVAVFCGITLGWIVGTTGRRA
jgi:hypothetical protein